MRLFNAQIIDCHLEGASAAVVASDAWACFLPRADSLKFTCIVDTVGGTSPTLTFWIAGSNADPYYTELTKLLLNAAALVAGTNTFSVSYSPQDATYPPPRYLSVFAQIAGTNPKAHLQVWVCGRGPQLLEAIPPVTASFASQYAAAQMIDDEDRLPLRKRALKQGASLFYPPELFLPSLKWER